MTTKTQMRYGDPMAMVQQAAGLFATHNTRNTQMARLTGAMPKGTSSATATLRKQTTAHMPIVRAQDLGKGRGDEVTFHLLFQSTPAIADGRTYWRVALPTTLPQFQSTPAIADGRTLGVLLMVCPL